MISVEEKLIDTMTATFHNLRTGRVPSPIPIPDDLPDNEIRQLMTYVNRFLSEFAPFALKEVIGAHHKTLPEGKPYAPLFMVLAGRYADALEIPVFFR